MDILISFSVHIYFTFVFIQKIKFLLGLHFKSEEPASVYLDLDMFNDTGVNKHFTLKKGMFFYRFDEICVFLG
jgi:hypothetical protein